MRRVEAPNELKRRLKRLAAHARKELHASMLEVLGREAKRAQLRERFAAVAARSEEGTLVGGRT